LTRFAPRAELVVSLRSPLTRHPFAETLSKKIGKPLLGVSHLEGHLYSFLLSRKKTIPLKKLFPMIGLLVSGGHTLLVAMDNLRDISVLGETRDDAVGEAFDKVARLLQLPYPGGPEIEKIAKNGNPFAIPFPRPMIATKDFDFSFCVWNLFDTYKNIHGFVLIQVASAKNKNSDITCRESHSPCVDKVAAAR
jgi:glycoprotease/Kae1 family metallohydrolase